MFTVIIGNDTISDKTHYGAVEWASHIHKFKGTYEYQYYGLNNAYLWTFSDSEDALIFKLKFS